MQGKVAKDVAFRNGRGKLRIFLFMAILGFSAQACATTGVMELAAGTRERTVEVVQPLQLSAVEDAFLTSPRAGCF